MIERLKQLNRFNITILLIVMSVFSFGLSVLRYLVTDSRIFLFLNWNLFLAFIPWMISTIIISRQLNKKGSLVLLILSWILFFPNSPYILTDLIHLQLQTSVPKWFDLILILSFAWAGLMYGFISLMDIEILLVKYLKKKYITIFVIVFLFIGSFGIYLGRFLRWNSWDVLSNTTELTGDVIDRLVNPTHHPRTWSVTILMGIMLNMMYFSLKFIKGQNK